MANLRKRRTLFLVSYGILTDKRNSYVFLKRNAEIRLRVNGNITLETRRYTLRSVKTIINDD